MKRWYVAYTQPGAEILAQGQLGNQGFGTFLPKCRKETRHARRIKDIIAPLFPRYIFVEVDLSVQRWRSINSTRGISYLLSMGEKPSAVPDGIVEELKSRAAANGLIELALEPPYKSGEVIEVTTGAFSEQVGNFIRVDARKRVVMLLNLLGREVEVRLPQESVRAYA